MTNNFQVYFLFSLNTKLNHKQVQPRHFISHLHTPIGSSSNSLTTDQASGGWGGKTFLGSTVVRPGLGGASMLRTGSHTCFHSHLPGSKRTRRPQATDPGSLNYRLAECGNGSPFRRKPPAPPAITVKDFTLSHDPLQPGSWGRGPALCHLQAHPSVHGCTFTGCTPGGLTNKSLDSKSGTFSPAESGWGGGWGWRIG